MSERTWCLSVVQAGNYATGLEGVEGYGRRGGRMQKATTPERPWSVLILRYVANSGIAQVTKSPDDRSLESEAHHYREVISSLPGRSGSLTRVRGCKLRWVHAAGRLSGTKAQAQRFVRRAGQEAHWLAIGRQRDGRCIWLCSSKFTTSDGATVITSIGNGAPGT